MDEKVMYFINKEFDSQRELPKPKNKWSPKVINQMTIDAHEMGEERWHAEHDKCADRISELRSELAKTIWTCEHMCYVAFNVFERGTAFPKSMTRFQMPETKALKE